MGENGRVGRVRMMSETGSNVAVLFTGGKNLKTIML